MQPRIRQQAGVPSCRRQAGQVEMCKNSDMELMRYKDVELLKCEALEIWKY